MICFMTADELRKKYLQFFVEKGHQEISSANLVPENDPTALFINSGMHPLVPYLLGQPHPLGKRLTSIQKCIRTADIEEVGDSVHLTFFEMLGNWSLGDYFKKEAINWSFEFLTNPKWLGLDPQKIYVSVFEGDPEMGVVLDEESIAIWQEVFKKVGIKAQVGERIFAYPKEKNWWGPAGQTGPSGPDTEMFYDTGKSHNLRFGKKCHPNCECGKFVEIWNDVFMEFNKTPQGKFIPLPQKNVDTGLGLERELMILQGKESIYETELFQNIIFKIEEISGKLHAQSQYQRAIRIIADHLRSAAFIIADGVLPSNKEQGSVLRRLIRRSLRFGRQLGILELFCGEVAKVVIADYQKVYPELESYKEKIVEVLIEEENKFAKTIDIGLREWEKLVSKKSKNISGKESFYLYETFGFPLEIIEELAKEKKIKIDVNEFQEEYNKHQQASRQGAAKRFSGGLADHSEATTKLHTATHLLQQSLRLVLGTHVHQAGSNITAERLRFDFTQDRKLTEEEIKKVEALVNEKIKENLAVSFAVKTLAEAKKEGALAFFGEKYQDKVKIYTIGSFSKEVCGGPHVDFTGHLGSFKIKKEEAAASGVRRIYATLN
ncbi:alanine--tRNA ligase [Candidatus Gottesmanbacteria bacterium]|nr:alanine--tRNA ligase [Candidatus Gottesmanbacteria bacterium]